MLMTEYRYLYPPRPEKRVPVQMTAFYEKQGWGAQYKKNGTCTVLYVTPEKEILVKTRHNDDHKMWSPTDKSTGLFKNLPGDSWYVFCVEVLHNKTKTVKDTVYIWDIVVCDGQELLGMTFAERQEILKNLFVTEKTPTTYSHYILGTNTWLAKWITSDFVNIMKDIVARAELSDGNFEDEGLVIKNPKAKLASLEKQKNNISWQVKCRAETKNYSF